jgi:hypothetical protein
MNASDNARRPGGGPDDLRSDNLEDSPMMAHLLEAMKSGQDVGEYGALTFVIVARHFMEDNELVELLAQQPGYNQQAAQALLLQVRSVITIHPNGKGFWNGNRSRNSRSALTPTIRAPATFIESSASHRKSMTGSVIFGWIGQRRKIKKNDQALRGRLR